MICRFVLADDRTILGTAIGATENAVRNVKLPDGIEHIEEGNFPVDLGCYKAIIKDGKPTLDEHGKLQLIRDSDKDLDDEIARVKEEVLIELIKPRLSERARVRLEGQ
jgi:hypothetical protein